jgi:hypothetical protein
MMVLDVIIVGPFLLDPSSQAHGRCVAGLDCPKGDVFFFGGHNELGGYMVTGLLITPHNWDELGYTCLLNVTNHLANLATSKVKDQPVSALRVKFVEHYNWF